MVVYGKVGIRIHRMIVSVTGPVLRLAEKGSLGSRNAARLVRGKANGPASLGYRLHGNDGSFSALGSNRPTRMDSASWPRFIRDHLDCDLGIPVLVQMASLSRAHFMRIFVGAFQEVTRRIRAGAADAPYGPPSREQRPVRQSHLHREGVS
jgi:hypothetical protein